MNSEMNDKQLEMRMHVRMHIIDESKLELQEMPQDWINCNHQSTRMA